MQTASQLHPTTDPVDKIRVDLAAAYRLVAHFGLDDSIFTHISARVADAEDGTGRFLINPYGLRFDEVTASNLVTVDLNGRIIDDPYGAGINAAGFTIHSAVHAARHDVQCVLHTHTVAGVAVSCQAEGLLPLNQWSLQFHDRIAFHEYEGIALDLDERERLQADLGNRYAMILRNHGLLACGRTIGEAFEILQNLEHACVAQLAAQTGKELIIPSDEVCQHTADQFWGDGSKPFGERAWPAMRRMMDRYSPGYDA